MTEKPKPKYTIDDIKTLLKDVTNTLEVVRDMSQEMGDKGFSEQVVQLMLAHTKDVLIATKFVAMPYRIPVEFFGAKLRYPQDCDAGYQLDEKYIDDLLKSDNRYDREYGQRLQEDNKLLEPKFLGDGIWDSSENCSDQGLSIFRLYDDFDMNRGDYDP